MANPGYVRSTDGSDADNGSTWALANQTLAGGFADAAAGDTIYVSDNHAETQASAMTLTSPGTAASPCIVVGADDSAEPPTAVSTAPTISTTGANSITLTGFAYYRGITFQAGDGASAASILLTPSSAAFWFRFERCKLYVRGNNSSGRLNFGANSTTKLGNRVELVDTDIQFSNAGQFITPRCPVVWRGGSLLGTAPTNLIAGASGVHGSMLIEDVDLSAMSSGNLVALNVEAPLNVRFVNCKLHASVNRTGGTHTGLGGPDVMFVNCSSGDEQVNYQRINYVGTETHETTIVRTGGASDGTTSFARKVVTTANAKFVAPYESEPIAVWCDSLSSTTLTVEIITDNVTLTDGEAWIEVSYQGTSGFPLGVHVTDAKADILASAANQATSSVTWTTTGLTTPVKQKLSVTFTPQEKGWALVRVCLAKASTTMYYCPKVDKA